MTIVLPVVLVVVVIAVVLTAVCCFIRVKRNRKKRFIVEQLNGRVPHSRPSVRPVIRTGKSRIALNFFLYFESSASSSTGQSSRMVSTKVTKRSELAMELQG